ncbi:diguanylate cyclase domain-containing protein [Marinobacterium sp. YM272]|uniref:sensor domain-containing protein n=1 Tax=Marinobacterium sp. YM272 TaxID=3421654 RepID=UPI003D7F4A74
MIVGWILALVLLAVLASQLVGKRNRVAHPSIPLTDHLSQAILSIEPNGKISYANPAAARLLGYEPGALIGLSVEELVPEQQRHHHEHWRTTFSKSGRSRAMGQLDTLAARHRSGRSIPVRIELTSLPSSDPDGHSVLATLYPRDDSAAVIEKLQRDAGVGTWEWDPEEDKLSWSQSVYRMFGLDPRQFEASYDAYLNVVHPDDRVRVDLSVTSSIENREPYEIEYRILRDGEVRHLLERNYLHQDNEGVVRHMWGSIIDITETRRAQLRLQLAETVFNHCAEGILVFDEHQQLVRTNAALKEMVGYGDADTDSLDVSTLLRMPDTNKPLSIEALIGERSSDELEWRGELLLIPREGQAIPVLASLVQEQVSEETPPRHILVCTDIRQLKAQQAQLRFQAMHDALTGLPNRRLFAEHLDKAIAASKRSSERLAVVYIDLDGFKAVNDTYGHEAGDTLLREIVRRIKGLVRESDTIARLGGDEFAIILPACGTDAMLEEILGRLIKEGAYTYKDLDVTLSLGAVCYPDHSEDSKELLILADQTMYRAKYSGKNRYLIASVL